MDSLFEKIKRFFVERERNGVYYKVITDRKDMFIYSDYFTPKPFQDIFYIEFLTELITCPPTPAPWEGGHYIDQYDSFVFGIYFVHYGDRIDVTDFNRTWECGYEAFEGSELPRIHFDLLQKIVREHGFDVNISDTEIKKSVTENSFQEDAVNLIKVMLMINFIKADPPYIEENESIRTDIAALRKVWFH